MELNQKGCKSRFLIGKFRIYFPCRAKYFLLGRVYDLTSLKYFLFAAKYFPHAKKTPWQGRPF